jgi:malate/lactate dehydrogenase
MGPMNSATQATLRKTINAAIVESVTNPSDYLVAVLGIVKELRLDPARCIPLGVTLDVVVGEVLNEAAKHERAEQDVRAALAAAV